MAEAPQTRRVRSAEHTRHDPVSGDGRWREWGGTAYDAKSGLLYVNANEMAWKVELAEREMPDGEPTTGKALYERYCASCHRADFRGSPPEFPSLADVGTRRNIDEIESIVHDGAGRMPGHPELHTAVRRAIVDYVLTGRSQECGETRRRRST